ncbi:MAG: DUF6768 family protein [Flavobacteriaceae bacterium]
MKNSREKIDDLIKEALTEEEATFYDELEEPNLMGKLGGVFKGKLGWLIGLMNVINLIFFVLMVYCVVQFFDVSETNELIKWASGGFACALAMSMIKLFVWLQMDKNDILRELKRLELQLASLAAKSKV